jgi:hypothetical protein
MTCRKKANFFVDPTAVSAAGSPASGRTVENREQENQCFLTSRASKKESRISKKQRYDTNTAEPKRVTSQLSCHRIWLVVAMLACTYSVLF